MPQNEIPGPAQTEINPWNSLAKRTIIANSLRGTVAILLLLFFLNGLNTLKLSRMDLLYLIFFFVLEIMLIARSTITWFVTKWRIVGDEFQYETGLIRRQLLRFPLSRIQAVDYVQPFIPRLMHLAEVHIVSAGHGGQKARLAYLDVLEATTVRSNLLSHNSTNSTASSHPTSTAANSLSGMHKATDLSGETVTVPTTQLVATSLYPYPTQLVAVSNNQLLASIILRYTLPWLFCLAAFATGLILAVSQSAKSTGYTVGVYLIEIAFLAAIRIAMVVGGLVSREWNFVLGASFDGYHVDHGLIQLQHETIPYGRIQALRVSQPLFWRFTKWYRVEVDVARQLAHGKGERDENRLYRTLLPVVSQDTVTRLLYMVFPGATLLPPNGSRPPVRAFWLTPFTYHFLAGWIDSNYTYAKSGCTQESWVIVPLEKMQSARYVRSIPQKILGLATVYVDTAGKHWPAILEKRNDTQAVEFLWNISAIASKLRHVSPANTTQHSRSKR